jgi:glyoxylase-like metal-dependent hydrolase (beta-lactamase superfamily II)
MAALVALSGAAPAAAATVPLPVAAVLTGDQQTSVVVDLSSSTRPGPRSASVTTGHAQPSATLVPLMSAGLAVTIVVDTSTADAATLPAWLSAGARFILEAPTGTQATVIGTSTPAAVIAPPQQGPTGIVAALNGVQAHGDRDTATALTLAADQFPEVPAARKLVVLYTGAADAGGPSATALATQFQAAGIILVVATTADASPYWTTAAEATGGFFAPAGHPVVVPALDQVETTLGSRYLVQFPTPAHRPTTVSLQVKTPDLILAADIQLPAPATPPPSGHSAGLFAALAAVVIVLLALAVGGALLYRSRRRIRRPPPIVIAHGRAAVPTSPPPPEP